MNRMENITLYWEKKGLQGYALFFLFWLRKRDSWYSLELPHWDISYKHQLSMFGAKIRKISHIVNWKMMSLEPWKLALYCIDMLSLCNRIIQIFYLYSFLGRIWWTSLSFLQGDNFCDSCLFSCSQSPINYGDNCKKERILFLTICSQWRNSLSFISWTHINKGSKNVFGKLSLPFLHCTYFPYILREHVRISWVLVRRIPSLR